VRTIPVVGRVAAVLRGFRDMKPSRIQVLALSFGFSLLAYGKKAIAQPAAGTMKQDAASKGTTDVATETFDATKKDDTSKNATEVKVQAGALTATGNSRSLAGTASSTFRMRREANELGAAAAVNYARAAAARGEPMETTVENYQGKVRYDRFLAERIAAFLSVSARRDRFQGLDLRMNVDPGLAYYFIDEKLVQLWAELGYDLQYDIRRDANLNIAQAAGEELDKTDLRHSVRTFLGYRHTFKEGMTLSTGLEYLQGVPETKYWRLNYDLGLSVAIASRFSLAMTFSLRYDNAPLPGVTNLDTLTALNLVYQLY
jgi:putative salt-induced outer membrane protein